MSPTAISGAPATKPNRPWYKVLYVQ
ncbi:MAG: hypothetical protein JWR79_1283, partial [Tardiphaga sp.]|nr:hypothetical protein [Tardiphaga sp.]